MLQVKDDMSSTGQRKPEVSQMGSAMLRSCCTCRDMLTPQTESFVICPGFFPTNSVGVHSEWYIQFCSFVRVSTVGVGGLIHFCVWLKTADPVIQPSGARWRRKLNRFWTNTKLAQWKVGCGTWPFWKHVFVLHLAKYCANWFRVGSVWRFGTFSPYPGGELAFLWCKNQM